MLDLKYRRVNFFGAPERTRTSGTWFRKPLLYPTELRAHNIFANNIIQHFEAIVKSLETKIKVAGERGAKIFTTSENTDKIKCIQFINFLC